MLGKRLLKLHLAGRLYCTVQYTVMCTLTLLQEYADRPVQIQMKLDKHSKGEVEPPTDLTAVVMPGGYYAVRAMDSTDGYCICKATKCCKKLFEGVVFENTFSFDSTEMCFEESKNIGHFDLDTVVTELISARIVGNFVIIDTTEIEEIILSTIEDS